MSNTRNSDAIETQQRSGRTWPALLLALGIVVGLAIGLYYAWIVNPIVYVEASPAHLSDAHQAEYIYMIARSYAIERDLALAERRLATLDRPRLGQVVLEMLETGIREGRPAADLRALAGLARDLGAEAPAVALFAPMPEPVATLAFDPELAPIALPTGLQMASPAATAVPSIPSTSTPTRAMTPQAAPADSLPRFQLLNREQLCPPENEGGRIELLVVNAEGTPQPGVTIIVTWPEGQQGQQPGGSDRFVTGFKEGGYGDFAMQPDVTYTVLLSDGRTTADDLRLETCADGQTGSWRLIFQKDEG